MGHFKAEGQWENESLPVYTETQNQQKKSSHAPLYVSKRALVFSGVLAVLVVSVMLLMYMYGRSIEGVWVRQQDDSGVAGMTVEVVKNGSTWDGYIIAMPENSSHFEVGQVKWFNIKKVGFGQYKYNDLLHGGTGEYYYDSYKSLITVLSGGDRMIIKHNYDVTTTGIYQVWIKQK